MNPHEIRALIQDHIRRAYRSIQLEHDLPIRASGLDGKFTSTFVFDEPDAKEKFAQRSSTGGAKVGTMTACLVSTPSRPCLDAYPIAPTTNEMGTYVVALHALLSAYGTTLFDLVMYDAGGCSLANVSATLERGPDYLFCLRANQKDLLAEAERLLGWRSLKDAHAVSTDLDGSEVVARYVWRTDAVYHLPVTNCVPSVPAGVHWRSFGSRSWIFSAVAKSPPARPAGTLFRGLADPGCGLHLHQLTTSRAVGMLRRAATTRENHTNANNAN